MTPDRRRAHPVLVLVLLTAGLLGAGPAAAAVPAGAAVTFSTVAPARECTALLEHDGRLYGGLHDGGLMIWNLDDPDVYRHLTATDGLSDPHVNALCWTGRHVWVATAGGGLTRLDVSGDEILYRQFASPSQLEVTAVAGHLLGDLERVYYAIPDGGVGLISDVLVGAAYTTSDWPGLPSNTIMALQTHGADLWIGTDAGLALLRDNVISNVSAGMAHPLVLALAYAEGMGPVVATVAGVLLYDPEAGTWSELGDLPLRPLDLAWADGSLWALGDGSVVDRLFRWDGAAWEPHALADERVSLIAGGTRLHAAGNHLLSTFYDKAAHVFIADSDGTDWRIWQQTPELSFTRIAGVDIDVAGRIWLGSFAAAGLASLSDGMLSQITEIASADNDSIGLFNNDSNILDVVSTASGEIWATQYSFRPNAGCGLLRFRPDLPDMDHVTPENSALPNNGVTGLRAHPEGPLFVLSDRDGATVLVDPAQWRDPAQWVQLPTDASGLGGNHVLDAQFDGRDRVWFTVDDLVGLVLWDLNGAAPADAPLTWTDTSDDLWLGPLDEVPGSDFNFGGLRVVEVADDGSLWLGGSSGLVHFRVDTAGGLLTTTLLGTYKEKVTSSMNGLLDAGVRDIALDRNGDLWVAHEAGLNRVRLVGGDVVFDAYTSVNKYYDNSLGDYYPIGSDVIVGLPGGVYRLDADAEGDRLVAGTGYGAVVIDVGPAPASRDPLSGLYLWPNPFQPARNVDGLRLGGLDAAVTYEGFAPVGGARVEIYNLEGQLVYRDRHVSTDEPFWDGRTLEGKAVASGPYLVRVEYGGQIAVKPLAVVY